MRTHYLKLALLVGLFQMPSLVVHAADCDAALIQDKAKIDVRDVSTLAALELVKQNSTEGNNWGANINVPVYGYPVGGGISDARSATDNYFSQSSLNWTHDRLVSAATETLSENAVEAYEDCIHNHEVYGVRIFAFDATPTAVTMRIRWIAPPGAPKTPQKLDVVVKDGNLIEKFPPTLKSGDSIDRIVTRAFQGDVRVTVNIGGTPDHALFAYLPPPIVPDKELLIGACFGQGDDLRGIRFWGPASEACNGLSEWGGFDAQVQKITSLGSCVVPGGAIKTEKLYGPVGEICGGIKAWKTYDNPVDVSQTGIAACKGRGDVLGGQMLWGPTGADCGGHPEHQTYSQYVQVRK